MSYFRCIMNIVMNPVDILKDFLSCPLYTSSHVFDRFKTLDWFQYFETDTLSKQRFLYIPGKRKNKVVLVAHADSFFDEVYGFEKQKHTFTHQWNSIIVDTWYWLGADDRAGCAILWLLKESWHSLLVTDGEEKRLVWSKWIESSHSSILRELNEHQFMIQFDRREHLNYKCYDVGTPEFKSYIEAQSWFIEAEHNPRLSTDIRIICKNICWVNLSIWYYNEHTNQEKIHIDEWLHTYEVAKKILSQDTLPRFILPSVN